KGTAPAKQSLACAQCERDRLLRGQCSAPYHNPQALLARVKDIQNSVLLLLKSINSEGGIIIFTKPLSIFLILPDGLLVMFI
ncbi:hypothetical protein, partial [Aeromonas salmonicida]